MVVKGERKKGKSAKKPTQGVEKLKLVISGFSIRMNQIKHNNSLTEKKF